MVASSKLHHAQVMIENMLPYETLLEARDNPEKYSDLQIRVCGWNDYFVNLSPAQQEQFLRQAKVSV